MTSFRALWVMAIAAALLAGGCRRDAARPRVSPSPTLASPSPTPTPSPTPSPPPTAPKGAASPELAARNLYDAWQAGDRTKASEFATKEAVDVTFSRPPFALDFAGCDAEGGGFACSYETDADELKMTLSGSAATGYRVDAAAFIAA